MSEYCIGTVLDPRTNSRKLRVLVPDPHGEVSIGGWEHQPYRIVRPGSTALAGAEIRPPVQQPEAQQN